MRVGLWLAFDYFVISKRGVAFFEMRIKNGFSIQDFIQTQELVIPQLGLSFKKLIVVFRDKFQINIPEDPVFGTPDKS